MQTGLSRALLLASFCLALSVSGNTTKAESIQQTAAALEKLDTRVGTDQQQEALRNMVPDDIRRRRQAANDRDRMLWYKIADRKDWEAFRAPRLAALKRSLGYFPPPPKTVATHVTGKIKGDGFVIENLLYESLPGLWVTANLYKPAKPEKSLPGIMICHSHHRPKDHSELQEMGMTWARAGCLVLVLDQIGHGERGQHPFRTSADYDGSYRVSRQDYYFRYDNGIQLHLAGRSLVGQMAWDMSRGVDVLLAQKGIDPERIILLGSVAGGGDPTAVTAAIDRRITVAAPFNFGGPQPETRYPLPDDAEKTFNYAGGGSWESTRNLQKSADGGFLPWTIVASTAPRRLIFAHEFNWDRPRDPVWKRLQKIYGFYGAADHLDYTHGYGELKMRPPNASHCTHIGRPHRKRINAALARWFKIPDTSDKYYDRRRDSSELACLTPAAVKKLQPRSLRSVLQVETDRRLSELRKKLSGLEPVGRREQLRKQFAKVLGGVEPVEVKIIDRTEEKADGFRVERIILQSQPGIQIPLVLLKPAAAQGKTPVVVAVAQAGKGKLLAARREEFAKLLAGGCAVCLPDLRGIGQTSPGSGRQRRSYATSLSSSELMLGGTMLGGRLHDLRSVLVYLRLRIDLDNGRIGVWGDSLAEVNTQETDMNVPRGTDNLPRQSEPLGGALALLTAIYEEDLAAVTLRGGLDGFRSTLAHYTVTIPHDIVVPGFLTAGDLPDLAAALAPLPLRMDELVNGYNRRLDKQATQTAYRQALESYTRGKATDRLSLAEGTSQRTEWLLKQMNRRQP